MAQPAYKVFQLPAKIELSNIPNPDDAKRQVDSIMDDAFLHAEHKLHGGISAIKQEQRKRLQIQAEEAGVPKAYDYLRTQISYMSMFYIGYRTGLVTKSDNDTGRDITTGTISNILTGLSESIGPHLTEQLYRAITASVDEVLEERYGKQR
jgi:uncharacterized protein YwbE